MNPRSISRGTTGVWLIAFIFAVALTLSACGGEGGLSEETGEEVTVAKAEGTPSGNLTISNWALYIDDQTVNDFQDETGIKVKYLEEINSYNDYFGKMKGQLAQGTSGGRSLMVVADWMAERMFDLGYIQKLDQDALEPAFSNLSPAVKPPPNDPDWTYSIPWQGGMTGLIVNKKLAPDVKSINDLFDPKYKGKVEFLSELRETPLLVMKADGIDPEKATTEQWLETIDKIGAAADSGQIRRFTGGDYAGDLATGDAVAVIGWAADAMQLQADNPNLQWVMPEEGCLTWWDEWVIPAGAPNPTAAYAWINFTYEPVNQAQIVGWTYATTPVAGVSEILAKTDPEAAKNPLIFPTEEYVAKCSGVVSPPGTPEEQREVETAWEDMLAG